MSKPIFSDRNQRVPLQIITRGISIGRRLATLRIDLFGGSKSLRRPASKTFGSHHPHPSDPCYAEWKVVIGRVQ